MTSTDVDLTALRAAFPPEYVGKLPRVTCPHCSKGQCGEHNKAKCAECGNYISTRHIHLDYVGHADVTIRLLDVDPEWTWAPKATDPDPELLKAAMASGDPEIVRMVIANAPPKFETDRNGNPVGLWISLTVGGVTRFGVGSCPSNQNDAEKVLIGDALRNAAMRFGVAVDLWAKGDRADPTAENATASAGKASRTREAAPQRPRPARQAASAKTPVAAAPDVEGWRDRALSKHATPADLLALLEEIEQAGHDGAQTVDEEGEKVTFRDLIVRKGKEARAASPHDDPPAPRQPEHAPFADADDAQFVIDFSDRLADAATKGHIALRRRDLELARNKQQVTEQTYGELAEAIDKREADVTAGKAA